jgi:hypothetical protein
MGLFRVSLAESKQSQFQADGSNVNVTEFTENVA